MMEIPAGKWCGKCPLCQYDNDDCLYYCNHPDYEPKLADELFQVEDDMQDWRPIRCPACLSAYPNGATIEIKPK